MVALLIYWISKLLKVNAKMYKVILAGGLASGKSTALKILQDLGAQTCSLDDIAKEVRNDPQIAIKLASIFGEDILDSNGIPIPNILASRAFVSPDKVEALNAICLPAIDVRSQKYLNEPCNMFPMRVLEVPLLDKATNLLTLVDESVAIVAPNSSRILRASKRGLDIKDAHSRIQNQIDQQQFEKMVDTIIQNDSTYEDFEKKIIDWWNSRVDKVYKVGEDGGKNS